MSTSMFLLLLLFIATTGSSDLYMVVGTSTTLIGDVFIDVSQHYSKSLCCQSITLDVKLFITAR